MTAHFNQFSLFHSVYSVYDNLVLYFNNFGGFFGDTPGYRAHRACARWPGPRHMSQASGLLLEAHTTHAGSLWVQNYRSADCEGEELERRPHHHMLGQTPRTTGKASAVALHCKGSGVGGGFWSLGEICGDGVPERGLVVSSGG